MASRSFRSGSPARCCFFSFFWKKFRRSSLKPGADRRSIFHNLANLCEILFCPKTCRPNRLIRARSGFLFAKNRKSFFLTVILCRTPIFGFTTQRGAVFWIKNSSKLLLISCQQTNGQIWATLARPRGRFFTSIFQKLVFRRASTRSICMKPRPTNCGFIGIRGRFRRPFTTKVLASRATASSVENLAGRFPMA